jgi:hypothetical protein
LQKRTHIPEAGIIRLDEDQMQSDEQAVKAFQAVGGLIERDDFARKAAAVATSTMLLEAMPEGTVGNTQLPSDLSPGPPPEAQFFGLLSQLHALEARRHLQFRTSIAGRKLSRSIHGLGSFNGFYYH